jgi:hypothetical protein
MYNKILMDYPHLHRALILKLAIKATNDTIGIGGVSPSMLVFGCIPRFPITSSHLPGQAERMKALQVGMINLNSAVAAERISEALKSQVPPVAGRLLRIGDEVMIYRETDRIWYSGYTVTSILGKQVQVVDRLGEEKHFSLHQVKRAPPEEHASTESVQILNKPSRCGIHYMTRKFNSEQHLEEKVPLYATQVSEMITKSDARYRSPEVQAAMRKELESIVEKGTWAVTVRSEMPDNANLLNGRYVITIKVIGTERESYKARYVVQGHGDKEKTSVAHQNTTAKQQSTRLLTGLAAIFGFRVCTHDVQHAYLQSAESLLRYVYLKPPAVLNIRSDQVLKLLRPQYGLCDAGDNSRTILDHLTKDLNLPNLSATQDSSSSL